jgi:hypothetical protein
MAFRMDGFQRTHKPLLLSKILLARQSRPLDEPTKSNSNSSLDGLSNSMRSDGFAKKSPFCSISGFDGYSRRV